jgi:hypothetical protein
MSSVDREIAAIAAKQHALFTIGNVVEKGGNKSMARRRVLGGHWDHPYEDVFRLAGAPVTYESELLAAILGAGQGACASHYCACRLLGFGFKFAKPEITVARGTYFRPKGITVHTSSDLDRCETVMRDAIPVTDPNRTLLDTALYLRGASLTSLVEEARRKSDDVTWRSLIECVATHARQGRRGINRMRDVISAGMVNEEVTETDGELAALGLLREHGFGEPALQHRVYSEDGRLVASMDLAYLPDRVDLEIDGSIHQLPEVILKDKARDHELRVVYGWTVERIPAAIPVHSPSLFLQIVRQTFKEARAKRGSGGDSV